MKVEVEKQPGFISKLQIELPPEEVTKEWDAIANSFARVAKIPGYRPGKAPRAVIDKRFRKEIQEELTKKLVSKSYHEAVEREQLRVASLTNIEDVQFGENKSMRFRATVVTAPEFELPDYKQIPMQVPETKVSDVEVDEALDRLRDQSADFVDVPARGLEMGDFAVLDFEGSVESKPISEIAPQASKNLYGGKKFWLHLAADNFLPKFCEQLIGQKPGETRLVIVHFPEDFMVKELAGKKADYAVTLRDIKEKVLPAVDDAFAAKLVPGKTLADLRQMIEHDIEHEKEHIEGAASLAAHRLKTNFILHRIAEREKIQVVKEDIDFRLKQEASRYDISPEKMRKELQQKDALDDVAEQILLGKTLDFLKANVSVETVQESSVKEEKS